MKSLFIKYRTLVLAIAGLLVVGGGYWYVKTNQAPRFETVAAQKGNVVQSLDEPGTTLTENSANLSFQTGGQITILGVREGEAVAAGTVLASLDTSALKAAADQADAAVAAAEARLDELKSGTRPEELAIARTAVQTASTSLGVAVGNAYAAADDAVQNQTDILFANPNTSNPVFNIPFSNSQTIINIQGERVAIGASLTAWYGAMSAPNPDPASLAATELGALQAIANYLNAIALAVNSATPSSNMPAAVLAGYRVSVATARTEVNNSITALTGAEAALANAQNQLALAEAGATSQDIEAQSATVAQAEAAAASAAVALQHAELVAPFNGTVENLTAKIGQVVSPGAPVLSLVNSGGMKVQAYVSEADVAKIKVGNAAGVSLDAFGAQTVFPATITAIASLQSQVNGSPAYEVTLHFTSVDNRIKDGMTGNVHIVIGEHDGVVEVPSRLVINEGNNYFVLVQHGNQAVKQHVSVGFVGDDGMTEIVSGVNVGDQLTNF